ncbi:MAG: hypothetical protein JOZ41_11020, partial [Chloroflexi bacterium]|nr:hypothetical protein [Chloroflexota bacterium]
MVAATPGSDMSRGHFVVHLLGPFAVARDGVPVDTAAWPRRGRSLLKLLAGTPSHRCRREEIVECLWPERTPQAGADNLRGVVHRIRRALGETGRSIILSDGEWLCLDPSCRWEVDLVEFERRLESAGDEIAALEDALSLYFGEPLMEDRSEEWAGPVREGAERLWREGCRRLVRAARPREPQKALEWLERLLADDPLDEPVVRQLLELLGDVGRRGEAIRRYEDFRRRLEREVAVEPAEETRRVVEALRARGGSALPLPPTSFVDRAEEVAAARRLLECLEARLLTLTGPGGTGKTRLALHVAREVQEMFADGTFFVSLAPVKDLPAAMAGAFGLKETGHKGWEDLVREYLEGKHALLVLDNCEHLLAAAGWLAELLTGCPRVKILATSREPLHLYCEQEIQVAPLPVPHSDRPLTVEELAAYDAVTLFVHRARAAKASFRLTQESAPAVRAICSRLDGLPLAIELAAARIKFLSTRELLRHLEHRLQFLTSQASDLPPRHRTLRDTIDWSYQLLRSEERALFARLSVFPGSCPLDAVEAVCNTHVLGIESFDGVASLIDKSLLQQVEGSDGEERLVMLETIREYALERLEESGEAEETRWRHAVYFAALAEAEE